MIAPLIWGPGAAGMQAAHGVSPYDALPNPMEGLFYGSLLGKHRVGFQSGGVLGYSTFFTGYDPGRHGVFRRVSLGRAALKAVAMGARALEGTQLASTAWGKSWLPAIAQVERYGFAAIAASADAATARAAIQASVSQATKGVYNTAYNTAYARMGLRSSADYVHRKAARAAAAQIEAHRAVGRASRGLIRTAAQSTVGERALKVLGGVFGGDFYDEAGRLAIERFDTVGGRLIPVAQAGARGAQVMGKAGALLGSGLKLASALQIAVWTGDRLADAAGAGYGAAVRTVNRMQQRLAYGDHMMSAAYYSGAASTERRRALMELNDSGLHSRAQLFMNEAAFYHNR